MYAALPTAESALPAALQQDQPAVRLGGRRPPGPARGMRRVCAGRGSAERDRVPAGRRLAGQLGGIDPVEAAKHKMLANAVKYPAPPPA